MELPRILIAEGSEEFREALAQALQDDFCVKTVDEGNQALQMLESFRPDILVLDLLLPGMDGISLMYRRQGSLSMPAVLATTRFVSPYVVAAAQKLSVHYLMVHPCDLRGTEERIRDLYRSLQPKYVVAPDSRSVVSNMLLMLNMPTKLRGYQQAREAILLMSKDPTQPVTKEIYPAVAVACDATAQQVERSIRSAIRAAWDRRDERIWRRFFPCASDGTVIRPTNLEFIQRMADVLLAELAREDRA